VNGVGAMAQPGGTGRDLSLVLGSGGARGYAHIGVIEELEAQGYTIRSIAGSSMGALVGGMHAAGRLDAFRQWALPLQRYDVLRLIDWTWRGGGFIKGERVSDLLRQMIGDVRIENLPIAYTAVAVDLDAQREVWFSRGPLFDAIRASIAIPTVFRPHHHGGRLLVDGGLLNPLPVSPTLRDQTDATIAVDINGAAETFGDERDMAAVDDARSMPDLVDEASAAPSLRRRRRLAALVDAFVERRGRRIAATHEPDTLALFARTLDAVQETITRLKLAAQPPDLLVTIPRNACAFYEFHRAAELVELGRRRTREALARWVPLRR
jgi:NTE family protein